MDALAQADEHRPDLAILDVNMPRLSGLQAARELARRDYNPAVVMLSMHDDEQFLSPPAEPPSTATPTCTPRPAGRSSATTSSSPRPNENAKASSPPGGVAGGEDRHRTNILEKLHLKDRLELARYAIRRGLVDA
jgi:CheY-like chemotaxis protein